PRRRDRRRQHPRHHKDSTSKPRQETIANRGKHATPSVKTVSDTNVYRKQRCRFHPVREEVGTKLIVLLQRSARPRRHSLTVSPFHRFTVSPIIPLPLRSPFPS